MTQREPMPSDWERRPEGNPTDRREELASTAGELGAFHDVLERLRERGLAGD